MVVVITVDVDPVPCVKVRVTALTVVDIDVDVVLERLDVASASALVTAGELEEELLDDGVLEDEMLDDEMLDADELAELPVLEEEPYDHPSDVGGTPKLLEMGTELNELLDPAPTIPVPSMLAARVELEVELEVKLEVELELVIAASTVLLEVLLDE